MQGAESEHEGVSLQIYIADIGEVTGTKEDEWRQTLNSDP